MLKKMLVFPILILLLVSCRTRNTPYDMPALRVTEYPTMQLSQSPTLFPYGVTVKAETAALNLIVNSSRSNISERMVDIQQAVDEIARVAAESDGLLVERISVNQINSGYPRKEGTTSSVQNLDVSEVTLRLTTNLAQHDYDFVRAVSNFNNFLNAVKLPESVTLRVLSVEADLGDLESYRSQIITQLYEELDAVKQAHGQTVRFEITGLYTPLKKMQLSDIEYYLYLEPVVTVIEY